MTRLAAALGVAAVLLLAAAVVLNLVDSGADRGQDDSVIIGALFLFEIFAFVSVGALVAARRPHNPIGWLLAGNGLVGSIGVAADAYARHALFADPGSFPAGSVMAWVASFVIDSPLPVVGFFLLLFLLFPDGRLSSPRWGRVLMLLLPVLTAQQAIVIFRPGELDAFPAIENPFGIAAFKNLSFLDAPVFLLLIAVLMASVISLVQRFRHATGEAREQLKLIVVACAFLALTLASAPFWWSFAPERVSDIGWPALFAISLASIPVAVGVAILRYRLYDIDLIINRALVYGALTAFLAGLYAASIQLFKVIFEGATGETSETSIILTTLLLAAAFTPAKNRLQKVVDRYFGQVHDPQKDLSAFDDRLRGVIQVFDAQATARQFLDEAVAALDASSGALFLKSNGSLAPAATTSAWDGKGRLEIPLDHAGEQFGSLILGPRQDGADYPPEDVESLRSTAALVGRALALSSRLNHD